MSERLHCHVTTPLQGLRTIGEPYPGLRPGLSYLRPAGLKSAQCYAAYRKENFPKKFAAGLASANVIVYNCFKSGRRETGRVFDNSEGCCAELRMRVRAGEEEVGFEISNLRFADTTVFYVRPMHTTAFPGFLPLASIAFA